MKNGAPYQTLTVTTAIRAHHGVPSQGMEGKPKTFRIQLIEE